MKKVTRFIERSPENEAKILLIINYIYPKKTFQCAKPLSINVLINAISEDLVHKPMNTCVLLPGAV